ncbi:MAG TPA: HAMP domain-containing sensor histidine kinase [Gaiellaceae bacterium]|nr:HAMP domain-containing sensor histidine kinase [Gaiellaceae bacterium]
MAPAETAKEERALHVLARVVADNPFHARELIDRICLRTRDAFGFKDVEWREPHALVPVPDEGAPPPDAADLSVLNALGEAAAAVADRARDVDHADRLKNDFVSIASHELRTPISVVHGIAATLHARVDDLERDQVHALLSSLVRQTDRLRDLADQLLDLSRLEAGPGGIAEPFHPRERLDELLPRIAGDRTEDVHVLVDPDATLVADPVAFERVAANLILNALRYGKPPVVVRAEANGHVVLVVEDRGPGVPAEFVPRLFERFSRSDDSRRSGAPGAGLGLAIACAYAEVLGGRVGYESVEPTGARFTLTLPAARS